MKPRGESNDGRTKCVEGEENHAVNRRVGVRGGQRVTQQLARPSIVGIVQRLVQQNGGEEMQGVIVEAGFVRGGEKEGNE